MEKYGVVNQAGETSCIEQDEQIDTLIEAVSKMMPEEFARYSQETPPLPIPKTLRDVMMAQKAAQKTSPLREYNIPEFKRKA